MVLLYQNWLMLFWLAWYWHPKLELYHTNIDLCLIWYWYFLDKVGTGIDYLMIIQTTGKHTIFGRVCRGMEIVKRLGSVQTDKNDRYVNFFAICVNFTKCHFSLWNLKISHSSGASSMEYYHQMPIVILIFLKKDQNLHCPFPPFCWESNSEGYFGHSS